LAEADQGREAPGEAAACGVAARRGRARFSFFKPTALCTAAVFKSNGKETSEHEHDAAPQRDEDNLKEVGVQEV